MLQEYLATWRPILAAATNHRFDNVFPTSIATPYRPRPFHGVTTETVYRCTGKYWHPHIVRTIWATEWIRDVNLGDFYSAAVMLNDKLETVIKRYAHLLDEGVAERTYQRLSQCNGGLR